MQVSGKGFARPGIWLSGLVFLCLLPLLAACGSDGEVAEAAVVTVPGAPGQTVQVTTRTVYYEINGATPGDLGDQMQRLGPTDGTNNTRHYNGWTNWQVQWNYSYNGSASRCAIGPVKVEVTITITLPHWNQPGNISPELTTRWNTFLTALQTHENGHRDNAVRAAQEIYRGLSALPSAATCPALQQAANDTGNHLLNQFRQNDVQYDQTTRHGATQGATFP